MTRWERRRILVGTDVVMGICQALAVVIAVHIGIHLLLLATPSIRAVSAAHR